MTQSPLNPFKVYSPEDMSADQVVRLFEPVAEGLEITGPEHVFIHGPRGCGKSMMLRYMTPDCQILATQKALNKLPYLGLYATIKTTELDVVEYERLQNQYAGIVLAEHSLVTFLGVKTFKSILEHCWEAIEQAQGMEEFRQFVLEFVFPRLKSCGAHVDLYVESARSSSSTKDVIRAIIGCLDEAYSCGSTYLRRSAFTSEYLPYQGPLLTYREFLFQVLVELTRLSFMPQDKPVYFLVDDADNLHPLQKRVLNTWVSFRTGNKVAFKISTQLTYNIFLTISNQRIDAVHDFREIHVSSIYTGASSPAQYPQWVEKVVEKRLKGHGICARARDFFPEDAEQENKIREIAETIKQEWRKNPKGYRPNDDAYRYARPNYIRNLGGNAKQGSNYRYAGFEQLVHISSGIVRFFLDNAAEMYATQEVRLHSKDQSHESLTPSRIEPLIQDEVVRRAADNLMFGTLDQLESDAATQGNNIEANEFRRLRNLIRALGGIFYRILLSDRAERRVFSIALSDDPPEEIMRIIRLGVQHGYFYESTIGAKEGNWRTRRYVMTRRLSPHFKLDPTGFSGYLFVTTALLQEAIANPKRAVTIFQENRLAILDEKQMSLEF
jgi:hypothetical protein